MYTYILESISVGFVVQRVMNYLDTASLPAVVHSAVQALVKSEWEGGSKGH